MRISSETGSEGRRATRLTALISKAKHQVRQLLNARIPLKADASDAGEAWGGSRIAAALETNVDTVARARQRLVKEGVDAVLTCKHS